MNEYQFLPYLLGVASLGAILLLIKWLKTFKNDVLPDEKPVEIKRPDYSVRIDVYPDNTAKIVATDAENRNMPKRSQQWFCNDGTSLVGYVPKPHVQQYKIEPPQATLEASTELVPVAVEVKSEEEKEKEENLNLLNQSSLDKKDQEAYNKLKQEQIAKGLIDTK
jgi:hypothetical protein